jgi:hypothetical protein
LEVLTRPTSCWRHKGQALVMKVLRCGLRANVGFCARLGGMLFLFVVGRMGPGQLSVVNPYVEKS